MFEGTIYLKAIPPWQGKLECKCFYVGLDGFDLVGEWFDTVLVDSVPKEIDFRNSKLAFLGFDHQTVFFETVKKDTQVLFMFLIVFACHQDIIKVDK